ncbi:glycoside hydrolase family 3 C-terminal domain-containing protein [Cellulomonas fimi]|uniref:Glycoside hydrolase family 3 domain protein n=1 Tax=Cellulomonas fimi (strain ATCC 484 / DSM 20113 / JCM 1341 / CCUG 24087 / LMG 16345 / NBRC 15513 / NCIMB 8980 / NCTC 7547 / NRS-133) TaxID=590998 RepID=F4H7F4_CELFA|nr:glycoside hydrolase family 3 C-terminal domain-containing protein [Cellulomonas fimi]AEE46915.1 glycoside hydrolase family 3 domain protein [Cellulomonas fimi ATCC 484]NNH07862.1 glycoside hydrolase family 3 protein [Cellulomonas fimi]VEH34552.1 Periplasmic beta-glucosidase precursor [Cellulomonas fimi]
MADDVQPLPPYRDTALPLAERARDLLGRLELAEKVAFLHQRVPAVPRLGLAEFRTGTEALHGVAWLGTATTFPQPVGLAATWDTELVREVGEAVGTEVRAKHAQDPTVSLNVWAPVVNPLRHPAWGRNEEGWSEDPHLTATLATAYARGLRGDHPVYWRTVPTLKHLLAYGNETDRAVTSAQLPPRALHEYELPAFLGPVAAGVVGAVMPSYNLVNGRPTHVSGELIDALRDAAPGSLLFVSDAGAPTNLVTAERYHADHTTAAAAAIRAGVDSFTDHDADSSVSIARITAALDAGLLDEADVDRAVLRQLELRLATGELDPDLDPWAGIGAEALDAPGHRELARRASAAGVVILENDGVLPLREGTRVAVVGPHADQVCTDWYSGTPPYTVTIAQALAERYGAGHVTVVDGADRVALRSTTTGRYVRPADDGVLVADATTAAEDTHVDLTSWGEGIRTLRACRTGLLWSGSRWILHADASRVGGWVVQESFRVHDNGDDTVSVQHVGSGRWLVVQRDGGVLVADAPTPQQAERFTVRTVHAGHERAAAAARDADVVVLAVGNDPHLLGRETEDRPGLTLPLPQAELTRTVLDTGTPTVLAVVSSYPYVLGDLGDAAAAVVWSAHAGQELGHGLVDVLSGDVEPAGRLAQSWPADESHAGDLLCYDVVSGGLTYWYAPHAARWPFGHGRSYASVEYLGLTLDAPDGDAVASSTVTARVIVQNTGARPADEVVQLYAAAPGHRLPVPHRRLVAHRRVRLEPGETAEVTLDVAVQDLAVWDVTSASFVVEPGGYELHAGSSSGDLPLVADLKVAGAPVPPRTLLDGWVRAVDHDERHDVRLVPRDLDAGTAVAVAPGARSGWVLLRDVDLHGVHGVELTVGRTEPGPASVHVEVLEGRRWERVATAAVPDGGRWEWHDVAVAPAVALPTWGATDVRLVLAGPVRVGEVRGTRAG